MSLSHRRNFYLYFSFILILLVTLTSFSTQPFDLTNDVFMYTNKFRQSKKLSPLIIREDLNAIAKKHSQEMANGKTDFGHDGFNKRQKQVEKIFKSCSVAENVAYGTIDGKEAVIMWEKSPGHRKNLLGNYKYVGIGVAKDRNGANYYTQIFVR